MKIIREEVVKDVLKKSPGLNDTNNIIYKDRLKIFERIRDIIYVKNLNSFLLSLESVPAIGILTKE